GGEVSVKPGDISFIDFGCNCGSVLLEPRGVVRCPPCVVSKVSLSAMIGRIATLPKGWGVGYPGGRKGTYRAYQGRKLAHRNLGKPVRANRLREGACNGRIQLNS